MTSRRIFYLNQFIDHAAVTATIPALAGSGLGPEPTTASAPEQASSV